MTSFCTDTIRFAPHLRPDRGILRAEALSLTADAQRAAQLLLRRAKSDGDALRDQARAQGESELATARAQAQQELDTARSEAQRVLDDAYAQAQQLAGAEQQRVLEQAAELLELLEQAGAAIVERVEDTALELTQKLFDKLVSEVTPRERLAAALKHVLQEAPPKLVDPLLRVHPDDVELLPEVEWPVKGDPSIARGACRLEAASGQWCAAFDAAVEALTAALRQGVEEARLGVPDEAGYDEPLESASQAEQEADDAPVDDSAEEALPDDSQDDAPTA